MCFLFDLKCSKMHHFASCPQTLLANPVSHNFVNYSTLLSASATEFISLALCELFAYYICDTTLISGNSAVSTSTLKRVAALLLGSMAMHAVDHLNLAVW